MKNGNQNSTCGNYRRIRLLCIIIILAIGFSITGQLYANPRPGDVFREYHLVGGGSNGKEDAEWMDTFVFIAHHTGEKSTPGNRKFKNIDLKHATKAEFVASYWGGHIGSANKRVIFNENPAVKLPLIKNTSNRPVCYFFQQCQAACEIPLDYLKQGTNEFRLEVDNQVCHSFNWGWFWTNQAVLRIYYDSANVDNPEGKIESPQPNSTISDLSKVACTIESGDAERVEFIGNYKDFSWGGTGEFDTWHGIFWMQDTEMQRNIGNASGLYPYLNWNNRWIPDQEGIKIAARIIGKSGLIFMTEAVEDITLDHGDRTVRMYPASDVPEAFATQTKSKQCNIYIPDELDKAFLAKVVVSTFSGGTPDREVYINGKAVRKGGWGDWHKLAFCEEYVPVDMLKQGVNTFEIRANYPKEHAFEINWPGPVLFVEYKN